jgi:hypothetical protein
MSLQVEVLLRMEMMSLQQVLKVLLCGGMAIGVGIVDER